MSPSDFNVSCDARRTSIFAALGSGVAGVVGEATAGAPGVTGGTVTVDGTVGVVEGVTVVGVTVGVAVDGAAGAVTGVTGPVPPGLNVELAIYFSEDEAISITSVRPNV